MGDFAWPAMSDYQKVMLFCFLTSENEDLITNMSDLSVETCDYKVVQVFGGKLVFVCLFVILHLATPKEDRQVKPYQNNDEYVVNL